MNYHRSRFIFVMILTWLAWMDPFCWFHLGTKILCGEKFRTCIDGMLRKRFSGQCSGRNSVVRWGKVAAGRTTREYRWPTSHPWGIRNGVLLWSLRFMNTETANSKQLLYYVRVHERGNFFFKEDRESERDVSCNFQRFQERVLTFLWLRRYRLKEFIYLAVL